MRKTRTRIFALAGTLSLFMLAACGSNEPSATTSGSGCANPPVSKAGTLLVGAEFPAPPFEIPPLSDPSGFEVDLVNEIAKRLNIGTVKWQNFPFTRAVTVGLQPPFDLDINEITITDERAKVVDFSDSYFDANQGLMVRNGTPIAGVTSIADVAKYQLGVQAATTGLDYAKNTIKPEKPLRQFDTVTTAANALVLAKSIDGFVMDVPIVIGLTKEKAYPDTSVVGQFITNEKYGILFKKGNPLVACVNQALASIKGDGTLKTLQEKWFPGITEVKPLS